jgi:phage/plasmid-like protein (TIGR03299 family)
MSHELDFTKGEAAIAYTGAVPWHGYGQQLDADQPLERWLVAAGMDYSVIRRPVAFVSNRHIDEEDKIVPDTRLGKISPPLITGIDDRIALTRSDNSAPLAIVGKNYRIVQPKEVLEFFRDLISDQGFKMHTAGVLADGKRVWALAETGKDFTIPGTDDKLAGYLLLATSYDGKFSTTAQFTSIRVVCNNTLSWTLNQGEDQAAGIVRIPHVSEFSASQVKGELGLLGDAGWNQFKANVTKLSEVKISKRQAVEFFLNLLGVTEEEAAAGKQLITAKKLIAFYESGPGAQFASAKNTTWGLVNAVSFFTDHGRRALSNGTRFDSAAFGDGARMKQQAFAQALVLANNPV